MSIEYANSETGELYEIKTAQDVKEIMWEVERGSLKAHKATVILYSVRIDLLDSKRWIQEQMFNIWPEEVDITDSSYMKSSYTQSKVDNQLMIKFPRYKELHKERSEVDGMMGAIELAADAIKMIDRSSWGRNLDRSER